MSTTERLIDSAGEVVTTGRVVLLGFAPKHVFLGPCIDHGQDQMIDVGIKADPAPEKSASRAILYDIAVAWLQARDEDILAQKDNGDTARPRACSTDRGAD